VLEKHYVPTRSHRARSVLTFFAQDSGTHNLVYANADIAKASQAARSSPFCDHWKAVSGRDPRMLIMDQKVTTQQVLAELATRSVEFLTPRMRSPALIAQINALTSSDFKPVTLNRPGQHNRPRVHDSRVRLSDYPGAVRQLIVTGLGREAPTEPRRDRTGDDLAAPASPSGANVGPATLALAAAPLRSPGRDRRAGRRIRARALDRTCRRPWTRSTSQPCSNCRCEKLIPDQANTAAWALPILSLPGSWWERELQPVAPASTMMQARTAGPVRGSSTRAAPRSARGYRQAAG